MELSDAIILGIIEGLTEFFPISSTGHLVIAQLGFGIGTNSIFFNTVIQVGAILAVLMYYREKLFTLAKNIGQPATRAYLGSLTLASVPVLAVGFLLHGLVQQMQQSLHVVIAATIGIALFMAWMQHQYKTSLELGKKESEKTSRDYLVTGVFQILSLVPGVSRSGITMLGAISRKFSFKDAMETSFLLGVPAMGAAALYESLRFASAGESMDRSLLIATCVGFIVSFITAFATISITLPILKKYGFTPFIIYRVVIGLMLLFFVA